MTERYHGFARLLHWLMALMVFGLIGVGVYMGELPDDAPERLQLINLHKATGFVFLWLTFARIALLMFKPAPALPNSFSAAEAKRLKAGKHLLYLAMLLTPISGWAMSNFAGYAVKFGDTAVPLLFEKNKALSGFFHEAHEILPWVLLALALGHILMVVVHKFQGEQKNLLRRML